MIYKINDIIIKIFELFFFSKKILVIIKEKINLNSYILVLFC